jgi:hypothetical protein
MPYTTNLFKKFLIDEILRSSHANVKDAIVEVNSFAETSRFKHTYMNWVLLQKEKDFKKAGRPKHIKEIISEKFNDY